MNRTERNAVLAINNKGTRLIKIRFPFNTDDLEKVRTLPDRKWNPDAKFWTTPLTVEAVEQLKEWKFAIDPQLEKFLKETKLHVSQVSEMEVPDLRGTLYPFQKKGVAFIEAKHGRALIGDEMGLGKTIQALAWLQLHPKLRPVVIVVPASLKLNWEREITRWMTNWGRVEILQGTKINSIIASKLIQASIIIINYDILSQWLKALEKLEPQVLIIDESHYIKNNTAKRTKAVKQLGKNIPHIIALSGTPIVNRPIEIYNAIRLIDPTVVPSRWEYARQYCNLRHNGYGWDMTGATNTDELHEKLTNTIMIRRRKKDVLKDLPNKIRSYIPTELDNTDEYLSAEQDFISFVARQHGLDAARRASNAAVLTEIEGLKQLAVKGKLKQAIEWIHNFLEVDGKLVVFCVHHFVVNALMQKFGTVAVKIDGSVTGANRQRAVDEFQNNENIRLFVGNIKAAGEGITLTAAYNIVILELPWTPGALNQAEDRIYARLNDIHGVNIYYLLAQNTIEERIARLIDRKRKVLDSVLDGCETESESLLSELMNEYNI